MPCGTQSRPAVAAHSSSQPFGTELRQHWKSLSQISGGEKLCHSRGQVIKLCRWGPGGRKNCVITLINQAERWRLHEKEGRTKSEKWYKLLGPILSYSCIHSHCCNTLCVIPMKQKYSTDLHFLCFFFVSLKHKQYIHIFVTLLYCSEQLFLDNSQHSNFRRAINFRRKSVV